MHIDLDTLRHFSNLYNLGLEPSALTLQSKRYAVEKIHETMKDLSQYSRNIQKSNTAEEIR